MQTLNNVHDQFAEFFKRDRLKPFVSLLSRKLSEGHICLDLKEILYEGEDFPIPYHSLAEIEEDLSKEPLVARSLEEKQPFILHNSQLYLQRYFLYETIILNRIRSFIENEVAEYSDRVDLLNQHREFIQKLFPTDKNTNHLPAEEKVNWQYVAAILGILNNFTIITGGPGTGKTTTVSKILELLYRIYPDLKVGLAAPTGKAAMRLAESLKGEEPTTIHRMLKTVYGSHHFKHNQNNPLNFDIIIIDEASMIDVALFAKLMLAIGPRTRLILLGDKDQLASVEAGSLFRDLCLTQEKMNVISSDKASLINSFTDDEGNHLPKSFIADQASHALSNHIIELKRSRRFDSNKGIGKLSKAIIHNQINDLKELSSPGADSEILVDMVYTPDVFQEFVLGYRSYINEADIQKALHKFNDLRVLCAVREGTYGLNRINTAIEIILNEQNLIDSKSEFYLNRPIIITKNHYDLGLYNGDIGIIRPDDNNTLMAWFEDSNKKLYSILPSMLSDSETVYAMTIHKSQGSEYERVLICLPDHENSELLTRELLYTAVTRAKKHVTIFANESTLLSTITKSVARASGIRERFNLDYKTNRWAYN